MPVNEVIRAGLFVVWLFVEVRACLDYATPPRSVFASTIMPMVFLPFISRRQFIELIPRRDLWVVVAMLIALIGLIASGVVTSFDGTSAEWFEHSDLPAVFAYVLWLSLMALGITRFRAKRLLR